MIVTERFTNFNRTYPELEELIMFSVAVAGKNANSTAKALDRFFHGNDVNELDLLPLAYVDSLNSQGLLRKELESSRIGNYGRLVKGWTQLYDSGMDLRTATVDELDEIHGIGSKTARMFVLHSRPNQRVAVLDTHILKFIGENLTLGLVPANKRLPKVTPSGKMYNKIEDAFLDWIDKRVDLGALTFRIGAGHSYQGKVRIPLKEDGTPDYAGFDLNLWKFYSNKEGREL